MTRWIVGSRARADLGGMGIRKRRLSPLLGNGEGVSYPPISAIQSASLRVVTPKSAALRAFEPASAPTTT